MYVAHMRALNPDRNVKRSYALAVYKDLLGDWVVAVDWGRVGNRVNARREVFQTEDEARRRARELVSRRKTARRRLGTDYEVLDEDGGDWLRPPIRKPAPPPTST